MTLLDEDGFGDLVGLEPGAKLRELFHEVVDIDFSGSLIVDRSGLPLLPLGFLFLLARFLPCSFERGLASRLAMGGEG